MKPSRRFRPDAAILERRAVLSRLGLHPSAEIGSRRTVAASFPLDADQSTAAGIPVFQVFTTVEKGVGIETNAQLIEHVAGSNTWTYYNTATLPNGQGVRKSVDVNTETSPGTYEHSWTIDEPDGTIVHEQREDFVSGNTTFYLINDGLDGGGSEVGTGQTVTQGATSTTDKVYVDTSGLAHHLHSVVVHHGATSQTETDTTIWSNGGYGVTQSTQTVVRLPPPTA